MWQRRTIFAISVLASCSLLLSSPAVADPDYTLLFDAEDWHYRIPLLIGSSGVERDNVPVELTIDFQAFLSAAHVNYTGGIDANSVRIVKDAREYPSQTRWIDQNKAEISFILYGTLDPGSESEVYLYFDTTEYGEKPPPAYETDLAYDVGERSLRSSKIKWVVGNKSRLAGLYNLELAPDRNLLVGNGIVTFYSVKNPEKTPLWSNQDHECSFSIVEAGPVKVVAKVNDVEPGGLTLPLGISEEWILTQYSLQSWSRIRMESITGDTPMDCRYYCGPRVNLVPYPAYDRLEMGSPLAEYELNQSGDFEGIPGDTVRFIAWDTTGETPAVGLCNLTTPVFTWKAKDGSGVTRVYLQRTTPLTDPPANSRLLLADAAIMTETARDDILQLMGSVRTPLEITAGGLETFGIGEQLAGVLWPIATLYALAVTVRRWR